MNLDNLQCRDPFIARPTFPSRKRRRSGYIIIKVSRVFETTNDILFFLFPPEDRLLGTRLQRKWWKRSSERMVFVCDSVCRIKKKRRRNVYLFMKVFENFENFENFISIRKFDEMYNMHNWEKYHKNTILLRSSYKFEFWVYVNQIIYIFLIF